MNTIKAEAQGDELTISGLGVGIDGVYDISLYMAHHAPSGGVERIEFIVGRNEMKSEIMTNANANQTGFTFKRQETKEDWGMIEPQTEIKSEGYPIGPTVAESIELLKLKPEHAGIIERASDIDEAWGNLELILVKRMAALASMGEVTTNGEA